MADSNCQVPLVKDGEFPPGESPPPYAESEMSNGYGQQQSYNPNFQPAPHYQLPPPTAVPTMPAPAGFGGPPVSNTVTSVNLAVPTTVVPVGPKSMQMRCFHCQAFIKTNTVSHCKSSAHFACCLLFFLSCGICSCVPYCMPSCRKVAHTCPNCGSFLGEYNS